MGGGGIYLIIYMEIRRNDSTNTGRNAKTSYIVVCYLSAFCVTPLQECIYLFIYLFKMFNNINITDHGGSGKSL